MNKDIFKHKKDKILFEKLTSNNENYIIEAIEEVENQGLSVFIPLCLKIYAQNTKQNIKNKLYDLFISIKESSTKQYFIDEILKTDNPETKKELLTICWNSSLDFYNYLDVFVDIFITDNFEIAFEAFTVIEWIDVLIEKDIIEAQIEKLKLNTENIKKDKEVLFSELILIIQKLSK